MSFHRKASSCAGHRVPSPYGGIIACIGDEGSVVSIRSQDSSNSPGVLPRPRIQARIMVHTDIQYPSEGSFQSSGSSLSSENDEQPVFIAVGGTGSRFLLESMLTQSIEVGDKPDYVFRRGIPGWSIPGLWPNPKSFSDRAYGFAPTVTNDAAKTLIEYITYLRADRSRTAIFNTFPEMGLFSKLKIGGVVGLLRDPLSAYVSWAKPERHGTVVECLGGLNDIRAIDFYIDRWCRLVREILRLERKGLLRGIIRYESAPEDAACLGLAHFYLDFVRGRTNLGVAQPETEEYVWCRTHALATKITKITEGAGAHMLRASDCMRKAGRNRQ